MNFARYIKQVEKLTVDNSPAILTAVGVVGTFATAFLTHKSTVTATEKLILEDANRTAKAQLAGEPAPPAISRLEAFKLTWMCYIPPVAAGTFTVTSIIAANRISARRAAALAAAYAISEGKISEYKEKITEKFGVSKEQKAQDELAQDRVDRKPASASTIIIGGGDVICFDQFTGRYFKADMDTIRKAENDTNFQIINEGYASLSDFYERVGLPATSFSEEVGWNNDKKVELLVSTVLTQDQKPCISFDFNVTPLRSYTRCQGE